MNELFDICESLINNTPQYMPYNLFYYAMFHINAKIIYSLKQLNLTINYKYGITYEMMSHNKIIYLN